MGKEPKWSTLSRPTYHQLAWICPYGWKPCAGACGETIRAQWGQEMRLVMMTIGANHKRRDGNDEWGWGCVRRMR